MGDLGYGFGFDRGFRLARQHKIRKLFWKALIIGALIFIAWTLRGESDVLENANQRHAVSVGIETSTGYANDVYGVETGLVASEER